MSIPQTWQEKRQWLKDNFGGVVTKWIDPDCYVTRADVSTSDGIISSPVIGHGTTGPASIEELFKTLTSLEAGTHLIGRGGQRSTVDPETCQLRDFHPF